MDVGKYASKIFEKLDSENQSHSLLDRSFGTREIIQSHGICTECGQQRSTHAWCNNCDVAILKGKFPSWTSENSKLDEFIRYTQINANESMDYLEWIEFGQLDLVTNINKRGSFSSIYSAIWLEGPAWSLDEEAEVWTRNGPIKVILKRLDNSQNIDQEFINQVSILICYR